MKKQVIIKLEFDTEDRNLDVEILKGEKSFSPETLQSYFRILAENWLDLAETMAESSAKSDGEA